MLRRWRRVEGDSRRPHHPGASVVRPPQGTVIVLPSAGMDVGKIYGEALAAFGVPNRSGLCGKSWTTHQPPTLIVSNGHLDLSSPSLPILTPFPSPLPHSCENWASSCPGLPPPPPSPCPPSAGTRKAARHPLRHVVRRLPSHGVRPSSCSPRPGTVARPA